jgi:hypothetical protein
MPSQVDLDGDGFVTGLSAVNVPVYANAAARDSLVAAVAGKLVWLQDEAKLFIYDGSDWVVA